MGWFFHYEHSHFGTIPSFRKGILTRGNCARRECCTTPLVMISANRVCNYRRYNMYKTVVDRSIDSGLEKWHLKKRSVDGAPRALSRHKAGITVCVVSQCCGAFFAVVASHYTAADKAPQHWPSHWLLRIAWKWMNDILSRVDECRRVQRGCNEKWPRDALSRSDRMVDG
jgi:hypothetical protein